MGSKTDREKRTLSLSFSGPSIPSALLPRGPDILNFVSLPLH